MTLEERSQLEERFKEARNNPKFDYPPPPILRDGVTEDELEAWFYEAQLYVEGLQVSVNSVRAVHTMVAKFDDTLRKHWQASRLLARRRGDPEVESLEQLQSWAQQYSVPNQSLKELIDELVRVRQTGTVKDYVQHFRLAVAPLPMLPEEVLVAFFQRGLEVRIEEEFRRELPATLRAAMERALEVEKRIGRRNQERRGGFFAQPGPRHSAASQTPRPPPPRGGHQQQPPPPPGPPPRGQPRGAAAQPQPHCDICGRFGHEAAQCWKAVRPLNS